MAQVAYAVLGEMLGSGLYKRKNNDEYYRFDYDYLTGCNGKIPYWTYEEAAKQARKSGEWNMEAYECRYFHHFHIGHHRRAK